MVGRHNPYAIIPDEEDRLAILLAALTDLNNRIGLVSHIFRSVIEQVLQDLRQALVIYIYRWQVGLNPNGAPARIQTPAYTLHCFVDPAFQRKQSEGGSITPT